MKVMMLPEETHSEFLWLLVRLRKFQCPDGRRLDFYHHSFYLCYFWHHLPSELINRPTVAVGEHGFIFASNLIQHYRLAVAEFFLKALTMLVVVHRGRRLVGVDGYKGWSGKAVSSSVYRGGRFLCRTVTCADHARMVLTSGVNGLAWIMVRTCGGCIKSKAC
ncbi:hypothetical protein GOBAR_DD08340 [Gossypium barbadense]|nr:hypothetical protein GOBAR_DD08340 [Gossypium barbadense]